MVLALVRHSGPYMRYSTLKRYSLLHDGLRAGFAVCPVPRFNLGIEVGIIVVDAELQHACVFPSPTATLDGVVSPRLPIPIGAVAVPVIGLLNETSVVVVIQYITLRYRVSKETDAGATRLVDVDANLSVIEVFPLAL